jgi:hypothetical protein
LHALPAHTLGLTGAPAKSQILWGGRAELTDGLYVGAAAAAFLLVVAMQWLLYARLLAGPFAQPEGAPKAQALRRWMNYEAALQAVVLIAAGGYLLLTARRHPPGIAWGAPGAAAVIANALALQLLLFRLMRILRAG